MWLVFLDCFNGTTLFPSVSWQSDETLQFIEISSDLGGCEVNLDSFGLDDVGLSTGMWSSEKLLPTRYNLEF
jgi:hypothetical protein